MQRLKLSSLKIGSIITTSLYDNNGRLLLTKGQKFTQKYFQLLERSGIEYLEICDDNESLSKKNFMKKVEPLEVKNLEIGTLLQYPIYNKNGILLLPKNTNINETHLDYFNRKNVHIVYEQKKGNVEEESIINDKKIQLHINMIDEKIRNSKNLLIEKPDGTPFSSMIKNNPIFVPHDQKKIITATENYNNNISQTGELLHSLCHGNAFSKTVVQEIVENFMNGTVENQPLLLSLLSKNQNDDEYLYRHAINVAIICVNVAASLGYSEGQIIDLASAALFADVGMQKIPDWILTQNRGLTPEEYKEVQNHVIYGVDLLEKILGVTEKMKIITYQSHERRDGKGYPKQRTDLVVNNFSKILRIADCYDALTSDRPFRPAMLPYKAMEEIIHMCTKGAFDPVTIKAFLKTFSLFPIGSYLRLNDNQIAQVIGVNPDNYDKPIISIMYDKDKNLLETPITIDLKTVDHSTPLIKDVIDPSSII